jgi:hypothetical protein
LLIVYSLNADNFGFFPGAIAATSLNPRKWKRGMSVRKTRALQGMEQIINASPTTDLRVRRASASVPLNPNELPNPNRSKKVSLVKAKGDGLLLRHEAVSNAQGDDDAVSNAPVRPYTGPT